MTESMLQPDWRDLTFNGLVFFMDKLADEIRYHGGQGASDAEWEDAQAMCVVEEAGEFIGAWRRWRGFARRAGDFSDVTKELSDVIIASFLMFAVLDEDAQSHVKAKLYNVISRGYVNKDADQPAR